MTIKINPTPNVNAANKYRAVANKNKASSETFQAADKVDFSLSAKVFSDAMKVAKDSPDVRSEMVSRIKASVDNGTYKIDSNAIAGKLISVIKL